MTSTGTSRNVCANRIWSLADKAAHCMRGKRTNIAGEHEEVIVSQATILLGVYERLDIDAIALGVLVLEYLEGFGVVKSVDRRIGHGVAVGNRHEEIEMCFPRSREDCMRLDRTKQTAVVVQLWPGKIPVFPRRKRT
jgi:hypothetical protein